VSSVDGANTRANVEFALGETPMVTANAPVNVTVPDAPSFVDITRSPDGSTVLTAMGAVGVPYRLWASTNVALWPVIGAWTLVTNDTITGSPFTVQDMEATNQAARFYRFSTP
jgi:hypothetical protein